ncbi:MAG: TonB-dependent receptor [Cytophagaceae bacterium]|nr:TonB-dependent receptor [Cytophagaceae bacterium]
MKLNITLSLIYIFIGKIALGQDSSKVHLLPEINVSALRSQLSNLETPASIHSISARNLKNRIFRTLPEFFENNGTFWLQKTNHGGGSLFLRGLTGNQTLTLIDGIRLNNSTFRYGPNQYLNTINPFMVSHMEVLSGGGSVQYGSDAIGGLLQIFTHDPNFDKKVDFIANTRYGSQNMEKSINSSLSISHKNLGLLVAGSFRDFGDLVGGKGIGIQTPSGYQEYAYDIKGVWKLRSKTSLIMAHQKVRQNHVPVYHKVKLEDFKINEMTFQIRNLSYLKVENEEKSIWLKKQGLTLSFQDNPEERTLQKNNSAMVRTENDRIKTLGFSVNNVSIPYKFWTINTGYEIYKDQVNSTRIDETVGVTTPKRGLYPNNSEYLNQSLFNLHQFQIRSIFLNLGLRYNTIQLDIPDEKLGISRMDYQAFVYNAGLLKKINKKWAAYGSFNTSFRAPNVDDLGTLGIVDFRYEIPSGSLKPEFARQLEFGLKYYSEIHNMQLSVYKNNLTDLITREKLEGQKVETYQVYAKMNTGKALIKGLEYNSKTIISKKLILNLGFCYTYGQDLIKNEPLRRIPPVFGNFNLRYSGNDWYIQPAFTFAGAQKRLAAGDIADNRIGPEGTQGFAVFNFQTGYNYKNIALDISANNLGNVAYKTHGSGIYQVGRSLWASLSFKL